MSSKANSTQMRHSASSKGKKMVGECMQLTHMQLILCGIDWQSQVVDAQPVAVSIWVWECPGLQDLVVGQQDTCK